MTTTTDTDTAQTVTMYAIGQYAGGGETAMDEFRAMRELYAALPADEIATYEYADDSIIVEDDTQAGIDAWGSGFAASGGRPMTNAEVVAYIDVELAGWDR